MSLDTFEQAVTNAIGQGATCVEAVTGALELFGVVIAPEVLLPLLIGGCSTLILTEIFARFLIGGGNMACSNTHTTSIKTQGPGVCCTAAAGQPTPIGARFAATDKNGHCFICEVKSSTSRSHPGVKVFKRGKANVVGSPISCPSTSGGCCALAA
jgi:hypothetical protein